MTDRDKLINSLERYPCGITTPENLADHLIANGVTMNEWRPASDPPRNVD